jgi:hypothetical protein
MDAEYLRSRLDYDPETGVFTWRESQGKPRHWNTRYAGKPAGAKHRSGAVHICVDGKLYQAHRLAWLYVYGRWPAEQVDHINRNPSDNRLCNLREASCSENLCNRVAVSGLKGASYNSRLRKFVAQIKKNRQARYLGLFDTAEAAHEAYCDAAHELHGDFANVRGHE